MLLLYLNLLFDLIVASWGECRVKHCHYSTGYAFLWQPIVHRRVESMIMLCLFVCERFNFDCEARKEAQWLWASVSDVWLIHHIRHSLASPQLRNKLLMDNMYTVTEMKLGIKPAQPSDAQWAKGTARNPFHWHPVTHPPWHTAHTVHHPRTTSSASLSSFSTYLFFACHSLIIRGQIFELSSRSDA